MEKRVFRNRLVTVLIIAAMALSLAGCRDGRISEEKKHVSVYLWSSAMLAEYAEYVQSQLPDLEIEFTVGNNDLDYYRFMAERDAAYFLSGRFPIDCSSCLEPVLGRAEKGAALSEEELERICHDIRLVARLCGQ